MNEDNYQKPILSKEFSF